MRAANAFLGAIFSLTVSLTAQAQTCPAHYSNNPTNKLYVKRALTDAMSNLARMKELAYLGSLPNPLVNLGLLTQRAAIDNEYQALTQDIDRLGTPSVSFLTPRTIHFLNVVLSTQNMGLAGTTLLGSTQAEAENNSGAANLAAGIAISNLWRCY
ncbi:MAG: hypothetical protein K1X79_11990 [Oligoflexia bacterium]|nr:hypothetical protein [Oligoflexia bacterium]